MTYGELLKPDPQPCVCGCELVGQPRVKIWVGETQGHVKACKCKRCVGGRQRSKSRRRENKIAKDLGGNREIMSGAFTGIDVRVGETVWIEETHNKALVAGIKRWWTGKGTTAKMERLTKRGNQMGVPVAFVASWGTGESGASPQVAVLDYQSFVRLVDMAKQWEQGNN